MLHYDKFGRPFEVTEVGGRFVAKAEGCLFVADTLVGLMNKVRDWELFNVRTINYKEI
jgi:hypothetical protein